MVDEQQATEDLLSRKAELAYMAQACAVAGQEMPEDLTQEYLALEQELRRRELPGAEISALPPSGGHPVTPAAPLRPPSRCFVCRQSFDSAPPQCPNCK